MNRSKVSVLGRRIRLRNSPSVPFRARRLVAHKRGSIEHPQLLDQRPLQRRLNAVVPSP
jgi:hypothetical protein